MTTEPSDFPYTAIADTYDYYARHLEHYGQTEAAHRWHAYAQAMREKRINDTPFKTKYGNLA